jgi:hypothetical protein
MEKLVRIALAVLFLLGIASAQQVDIFGGYSGLDFHVPSNTVTSPADAWLSLKKGWDISGSVGQFHHLAFEVDLSGHSLSDCGGNTGKNCSNFSIMGGPRFTLGDRSKRFTYFAHGLFGRDRMNLIANGVSQSDSQWEIAGGGGVDYWVARRIGIQLGPFDYIYTRHLFDQGVPSQRSIRVSAGVAFRFGGVPEREPKAKREPKSKSKNKSESTSKHRLWRKSQPVPPAESQPTTVAKSTPQEAQPLESSMAGHGMQIASLGVVVAPQEFDGAKILEIMPGGVAEMASLKAGDLVKTVDGKAVRTPMELAAELSDKTGKVRVGILRGTSEIETVILLSVR